MDFQVGKKTLTVFRKTGHVFWRYGILHNVDSTFLGVKLERLISKKMRRPKKPQRYNWFVITLCSPTMKTIGPQKEWLGTYRFNPRGVFPVAVIRMQRTGLENKKNFELNLKHCVCFLISNLAKDFETC